MIDEEVRREIERVVEEKIAPLRAEHAAVGRLASEIREMQIGHAGFERDMREGMNRLAQGLFELSRTTNELASAQARTDESIQALFAAQARTDASIERLSAAQARTDASIERLSAAQTRTDESLQELARRTDASIDRLSAAQARTEESVRLGFESVRAMFGQTIEEIAAEVVPHYLRHEEGVEVEPLHVDFFRVGNSEFEIDLCGDARDEQGDVLVLCEAKTTIDLRDVDRFERIASSVGQATGRRVRPVMFPARCPGRARARAAELGVTIVPWRYQYRIA